MFHIIEEMLKKTKLLCSISGRGGEIHNEKKVS
jgi:hypothetical protein